MTYAYFAKHHLIGWVCVSMRCTGSDTAFYDKHFISKNGYVRTKIVELD